MRKIGIFSLDSKIYNYGGILQEFALLKILERYGQCEIIDYDLSSELNTFSVKRNIINIDFNKFLGVINKAISKSENVAINLDVLQSIKIRNNKFDVFRNDFLLLSHKTNFNNLIERTQDYDFVFCGSDQIWNPDYNKPSFFLNFVPEQKRIIYAASVGKNQLSKRQKKVYQQYLRETQHISVRENDVLSMFDESISSRMKVVLDPTLLLTRNEWEKIETNIPYKDFIFCYFLNHTEEKINAAKMFANKYKKRIIAIPYLHNHFEDDTKKYADIILSDIGPREFISLIHHADCIITDSFHACVFSLLFDKCFFVFGRKDGSLDMNGRIKTLLGYWDDADDRFILPSELIERNIDKDVHLKGNLNDKVKYSIEYIEESIYPSYGNTK